MGRGNGIDLKGKFITNANNKSSGNKITFDKGEKIMDDENEVNEESEEPEEVEETEDVVDFERFEERLDELSERVDELGTKDDGKAVDEMSDETEIEESADKQEDGDEEDEPEGVEENLDNVISMLADLLDVPVDEVTEAISGLMKNDSEGSEDESEVRDVEESKRKAVAGENSREDFIELSEDEKTAQRGSLKEKFEQFEKELKE